MVGNLRQSLALLAAVLLAPALAAGGVSPSKVLEQSDAKLSPNGFVSLSRQQTADLGEDKTLSPYLYVAGGDPATERLPLKETSAEVQIAGVIARVKVHQIFENSGNIPIEAVYVFPASTRAAVHGMRMKIGARTVEAKIERKQEARAQYAAAKAAGQRASLLEQQRPNVFTMNVANLMPRDRIEVELDYSEMLVPDDGVYEFVYPTVVGPRYGGGANPQTDKWIANPYLSEGQGETYRFDIKAHLETGIPLKELVSPSHKVKVDYASANSADVRLDQSGGGNKDFILRYRLAGDRVETGLLTWQGEKENFFALMMEPPQRPSPSQIPPREYIFVVDVSGSMHGFPLDTSKALMNDLLRQMRPSDFFNVVLFSGAFQILAPQGSLPATSANIGQAAEAINRQQGGGGTELLAALRGAYAIPRQARGTSRTVVVITDGFVGVEAQSFKFVREHLNEANLFAFGIGTSVNRALMEGMARAGQGEPFIVLRPDKAAEQALKLRQYIEAPVLTDINVRFNDFEAYEVAPSKVPDLMARRPLVVFGKYRGAPRGNIQVTGMTASGRFSQSVEVAQFAPKAQNSPLRWLWARKWVSLLDDEVAMGPAKELEDAITDLGLSYTLLTNYTSFVAIDSEKANRTGQSQTVDQPLPLPEGVSNYAVGSSPSGNALSLGGVGTKGRGGGLGGYGTGAGGGGMGISSMPSPAAPPVAAAADGPAPRSLAEPKPMAARRSKVEESFPPAKASAVEKEKDEKQVAVGLQIQKLSERDLANSGALMAQLETLLKAQPCIAQSKVVLRLTIDANGKVLSLQVLSGDEGLASCLRPKLMSLVSAARATAASGILEVAVSPGN